MSKKIFLIAGEPSGDALGAALMRALKAEFTEPPEFVGIGGPLMEEEGLDSLLPMDELSVMGIVEVLWQLPRLLKLINGVVSEINKHKPDIVVTIDFPDFNFQVARILKKRGEYKGKVIHYVAPTVWAWRPGRAKKIAAFLDGLICLFPFEPPYFTKHGLKAEFVGHPLVEKGLDDADPQGFREEFQIPPDAPVLGLFFGSRVSELKTMAPYLKDAATIIIEQYPNVQVVIPTLQSLEFNLRETIEDWGVEAIIVANPDYKWDAFAACTVGLAVSGTVGLELAYMGVPHVIAYKMQPANWMAIKMLAKVKYAHLANILLGREVIPEYLQGKCTGINISKGLLRLLKQPDARAAQIKDLAELKEKLAGDGQSPSQKAAAFIKVNIQ